MTPELMDAAGALITDWRRDSRVQSLTPVQLSTLRAMIAAALADARQDESAACRCPDLNPNPHHAPLERTDP